MNLHDYRNRPAAIKLKDFEIDGNLCAYVIGRSEILAECNTGYACHSFLL